VDKEGFVAGGHQESRLFVGPITDLHNIIVSILHANRRIDHIRIDENQ
jgi:hypothetical protein